MACARSLFWRTACVAPNLNFIVLLCRYTAGDSVYVRRLNVIIFSDENAPNNPTRRRLDRFRRDPVCCARAVAVFGDGGGKRPGLDRNLFGWRLQVRTRGRRPIGQVRSGHATVDAARTLPTVRHPWQCVRAAIPHWLDGCAACARRNASVPVFSVAAPASHLDCRAAARAPRTRLTRATALRALRAPGLRFASNPSNPSNPLRDPVLPAMPGNRSFTCWTPAESPAQADIFWK